MKCKVINVKLDASLGNHSFVEDTINIWLKQNPDAKIKHVCQTSAGVRNIITTIFYE